MNANLQVIKGTKKEKPNYGQIYERVFREKIKQCVDIDDINYDLTCQIIYHGIMYVNNKEKEVKITGIEHDFNLIGMIKSIISTITPRQLMIIFPLRKQYDGTKYQMKDYFTSISAIEELGIDKQIGNNVDYFLTDYHNANVRTFCVKEMCLLSDLRRAEGKKGLFEELAALQGKHLTTYTKSINSKGKEILTNNDTGKTVNIKKIRPKYLKIV